MSKVPDKKGSWVGYRPDIKILDCTVRDGGLINDHKFSDDFVKAIHRTCAAAGVDYMEIGYKASKRIFAPSEFGAWKYCDEDDVRRIVGDGPSPVKLAVMADAERTDYHEDILPKEKSVIDLVRVAAYIHQIPTAVDMIKDAHDKGYETVMQLMSISVVGEHDACEALEILGNTPVKAVYLVDSFGALYPEQVRGLTRQFLEVLVDYGKEVGFHGHNNRELAFANTIEALICGASRLDVTINGIGRGAGNCASELLVGFLHNPKFRLRPILECCRDVLFPLSKQMDWGYSIPYLITGQLNRHPRAAIEARSGPAADDYVAFYDRIMEEE